MLKKIGLKIMVLIMLCVMLTTDSLAQIRIRFARGRTSTSVAGRMAAGGARSYVLRAARGQTLTATVSCGNGKCDFAQGDLHDTQYSEYVERNGDVYITLHNHGTRATNFTMTVSIQ